VTLASLGEVTFRAPPGPRPIIATPPPPQDDAEVAGPPSWWKKHFTGNSPDFAVRRRSTRIDDRPEERPINDLGELETTAWTTIEYVPAYFDVCAYPGDVNELILQSAGLPEIFPARRIGENTYVDGGIADNVPLAALADMHGHAAIIVVPLDSRVTEDVVRKDLTHKLNRLGRSVSDSLPELLLLTPSRPLGNFLTGTLDFRAAHARALMQMGYCDTIRYLAKRKNNNEPATDAGRR
jgi:hypothetical protein